MRETGIAHSELSALEPATMLTDSANNNLPDWRSEHCYFKK